MDKRKILKNTGKGLLTLVSPPIGLPTFFKGLADKITSCALGVLASTAGYLAVDAIQQEKLYEDPNVLLEKDPTSYWSIPAAISFPIIFVIDRKDVTKIYTDKDKYFARGEAIKHNPETGRYELRFDEGTRFEKNGPSILSEFSCLKESRERLEKLRKEGDILGAREAAEDHKRVLKDYLETQYTFVKTVEKMNAELEELNEKPREEETK